MAQNDGVYVFDSGSQKNGLSDVATLAALSNNGGFGGMNNPLWMMFMYPFILPFLNMYGGFGGSWYCSVVYEQLKKKGEGRIYSSLPQTAFTLTGVTLFLVFFQIHSFRLLHKDA